MSDRFRLAYPDHFERRRAIAVYWIARFRGLRAEEGTTVAAGRLRKMGVPIELALLILGVAPTRGLPPRAGDAPDRVLPAPAGEPRRHPAA